MWGLVAVGVYICATILLFFYATTCSQTFCGLMIVLTGMPWLLVLDYLGGDSYNSGVFGFIAVLLNIMVFYFFFAFLQTRHKKK